MKKNETLLIYSDSERDANLLYATGVWIGDPFIFLQINNRPTLVLHDLEWDRVRVAAPHCALLPLVEIQNKIRSRGKSHPKPSDIIAEVLRSKKIRRVTVPETFPLSVARELESAGFRLDVRAGQFFPAREIKSAGEVKKITEALRMAEAGVAAGVQALKQSKIGRNRQLIYRNAPLTSERLRAIIDTTILEAGGHPAHSIVAGGLQACDPHECGHGPLRAHEPIILDIFPRSQKTGYFGDITRTVVRGRATEAARKLYATVKRAQEIAFENIRPGVETHAVHRAVATFFEQQGYKTGKVNGRMQGFFHGTGHGLGLDIHEPLRMGAMSTGTLKAGQVITNEPGLYYPGIGGVRLEDDAVVTKTGSRNFTKFEKVFEV